MGCYGIGISRLLMAILEQHNEDLKVFWPNEVRPFDIHVIPMAKPETEGFNIAEELYNNLVKIGLDVLFDDRSETAGVKFNDADLIGCNYRIIVGRRIDEGFVELLNRRENKTYEITIDEVLNYNYI